MSQLHTNPSEIADRGRELYESKLRSLLEPLNSGKYIVIDIETGEYEMDVDGEVASARAREKRPNGIRYGMRIGHAAWGKVGGNSNRHAK
ncbi:MAG: hypothetical protein ABJA67_00670 [Chthonomonadales bacterium]